MTTMHSDPQEPVSLELSENLLQLKLVSQDGTLPAPATPVRPWPTTLTLDAIRELFPSGDIEGVIRDMVHNTLSTYPVQED